MKVMEATHPYRPPPSMLATLFSEFPLVDEIGTIFKCIKSFPEVKSCGRDGLRAQHILDALRGDVSVVARDLLYAMNLVFNLWIRGRCYMSLT